jgi:hypothetical protein
MSGRGLALRIEAAIILGLQVAVVEVGSFLLFLFLLKLLLLLIQLLLVQTVGLAQSGGSALRSRLFLFFLRGGSGCLQLTLALQTLTDSLGQTFPGLGLSERNRREGRQEFEW